MPARILNTRLLFHCPTIFLSSGQFHIYTHLSPMPDVLFSPRVQFHIYTHLCPMPDVPRPPIHTHVRFADRKRFASAKDTQWVRDRQRLEADKPANVNEIMLMDERGLLLEGMSSNFGVLVRLMLLPFSLASSIFPIRMQFSTVLDGH
jgi:hypothetical protein